MPSIYKIQSKISTRCNSGLEISRVWAMFWNKPWEARDGKVDQAFRLMDGTFGRPLFVNFRRGMERLG